MDKECLLNYVAKTAHTGFRQNNSKHTLIYEGYIYNAQQVRETLQHVFNIFEYT